MRPMDIRFCLQINETLLRQLVVNLLRAMHLYPIHVWKSMAILYYPKGGNQLDGEIVKLTNFGNATLFSD